MPSLFSDECRYVVVVSDARTRSFADPGKELLTAVLWTGTDALVASRMIRGDIRVNQRPGPVVFENARAGRGKQGQCRPWKTGSMQDVRTGLTQAVENRVSAGRGHRVNAGRGKQGQCRPWEQGQCRPWEQV